MGTGSLSGWCGGQRDQGTGPKEKTDRDIKVSAGLSLVVSTFGMLGISQQGLNELFSVFVVNGCKRL